MVKVSVIMGSYNETETDLRKSIDSILNQTYRDFEFIIILDNPSNELHKKILNEYKNKDKRIKVLINEKNLGLAKTLNKGIEIAKGEYIARTDADDISLKDRLKKQVEFLDKNKNICVLATNKIIIDQDDKELYKGKSLPTDYKRIAKLLMYQSILSHSSVMYRKKEIESINSYRLLPTSQDYDLWIRCIENNLNISIIDEYLVKNKIRTDSISNTNLLRQWSIHEYILKMHKKWKKTGINTYDQKNLENYLSKNKVFNEKEIKKYTKARNYLRDTKTNVSNKKYFKAFISFIKSILSHKKIIKLYIETIKYKINK